MPESPLPKGAGDCNSAEKWVRGIGGGGSRGSGVLKIVGRKSRLHHPIYGKQKAKKCGEASLGGKIDEWGGPRADFP